MAYATPEDIAQAREMDLLTYLRNYEPGELVKVANGTYCTREHDSLKISNGKWYWFSRSIGGASALDYLIRVKGYSLPVAVETILGRAVSKPPVSYSKKNEHLSSCYCPKETVPTPMSHGIFAPVAFTQPFWITAIAMDYCTRGVLIETPCSSAMTSIGCPSMQPCVELSVTTKEKPAEAISSIPSTFLQREWPKEFMYLSLPLICLAMRPWNAWPAGTGAESICYPWPVCSRRIDRMSSLSLCRDFSMHVQKSALYTCIWTRMKLGVALRLASSWVLEIATRS